jgi:hypothetical protein
MGLVAQAHDRPLAVLALDLSEGVVEGRIAAGLIPAGVLDEVPVGRHFASLKLWISLSAGP